MENQNWRWLQLFAEGGEGSTTGAEGAANAETGVSDAAAEHQRLRELGVPESKIRKNRLYKLPTEKATAEAEQVAEPEEKADEQVATAEEPTKDQPKRMTWDEIKADPEYSEQLNKMMRDRLKKSKGAEESLEKLRPALDKLSMLYELDPDNLDYAALAEKIRTDKALSERRAMQRGVSEEVSDQLDEFALMKRREAENEKKARETEADRMYISSLRSQEAGVKEKYPGYDLQAEIKNPMFVRLTRSGVPSVTAYEVIHKAEIDKRRDADIEKKVTENVSNAVRSGTMRPQENGATSSAPSALTFDYRTASKEQRNALKQRIKMAAARGEKLYPGQ